MCVARHLLWQGEANITLIHRPAQDCSVLAKYMTPLDLEKAQSCPPERGVLAEPYGNFDSVPIPVLPGKLHLGRRSGTQAEWIICW